MKNRLASLAVLALFLLAGSCMAGEAHDCSERGFVPSADQPPGNLNLNHWRAHQALGQENIPAALKYLEAAVAEGAPYVASMLGDYVERGVCVPPDPRRALALYLKGAAGGDEAGMLLAGLLLLNGRAGVTDPAMAGELFRAVTSRFPKPKEKELESIQVVIGPRPVPHELEEAAAWAGRLSAEPGEEVMTAARRLIVKDRAEYEAACNLLYSVKTPEGRFQLGRVLLDEKAGFPEQTGYALRMIYDAAHRGNTEAMELLGRVLANRPSLDDRQTGLMWLIAAEENGAKAADAIREAENRLPASRVAFAREQVKHGLLVPPRGQSEAAPQLNCLASSDSWRASRSSNVPYPRDGDPVRTCQQLRKTAFDEPRAAFALSQLLNAGERGLKPDPEQADFWLIMASNAGYPPAMAELGRRLLRGDGMPTMQPLAFELLYAAMTAGEEVGSLLRDAEEGLPSYIVEAVKAEGGRSVPTFAYTDAPQRLSQPACENAP